MNKEIFRLLKPFIGKASDLLNLKYELKKESGIVQLMPPDKETADGEYFIGYVLNENTPLYPFGLREQELLRHILITGSTGTGKTNTTFILLNNFIKENKPFIIFDWKRNYRELLIDDNFKDILVFTVGREISEFQFNPLIPPKGINPDIWLNKLIEIIGHAYFLAEGALSILQKAIDHVYKRFEIYKGFPENYPTFYDVLNYLYELKIHPASRKYQWLESSKRTIEGLCFRNTGKVFLCQENHIEELLKRNVILELDSLNHSNKIFFIETLLLWVYYYRLNQPDREEFLHTIIIEEAHRLFRKNHEYRIEEPVLNIMLREIRELCESVILIAQNPSLIPVTILSNTYTTISHNLKHEYDVNTIAQSTLLDYNDKEYLGILRTGHCIIKLQDRYLRPFCCKIPLFKIRKGNVTDFDIRKKMQSYSSNSDLKYTSFKNHKAIPPFSNNDIYNNELTLLLNIAEMPFLSITGRYRAISASSRAGNELKNGLIRKGFAKEKRIQVSKNSSIKLLYLTNKGAEFLKERDYKPKITVNGESVEHLYWKNKIRNALKKKGFIVNVELGDIDLIAVKNGSKIAIEIETGKSNVLKNIEKLRNLKCYKCIILFTNKNHSLNIKSKIIDNSIKVMTCWDFIEKSLKTDKF